MICLCVCVWVWVWVCLCLCVSEKKDDEERSHFVLHKEERKKCAKREINKIMVYTSYSNHTYIDDYCSKCVNMHNFRRTDMEDFWDKMCKIGCFLYFANVYIY